MKSLKLIPGISIPLLLFFFIGCDSAMQRETKATGTYPDSLSIIIQDKILNYTDASLVDFDSSMHMLNEILHTLDTIPDSLKHLCILPYINIAREETEHGHTHMADSLMKLADSLFRQYPDSTNLPFVFLNKGLIAKQKGFYDTAIYYYRQALHYGELFGDTTELLPAMINLGNSLLDKEYTEEGMDYLKSALKLASETGASQNFAEVANSIGVAYEYRGNLSQAMQYYKMAIDTLEKIKSQRNYLNPLNNLANTYLEVGNDSLAEKYYLKVLKLSTEMNQTNLIITALINLGNFCLVHENYDKALYYTLQAHEKLKSSNNRYLKSIVHLNLGLIYSGMEKPLQSRKELFRAHKMGNDINFFNIIIEANMELGKYYLTNGKPDSAYHYALIAYKTAHDNQTLSYLPRILRTLAQSTRRLGLQKESLDYYQLFDEYNSRYYDTLMTEKNRYFAFEYELQKSEAENELLIRAKQLDREIINNNQKELKQQRLLIILFIVVLILVLVIVVLLIFRTRTKSKANSLLQEKNEQIEKINSSLEKENKFKDRLFSLVSHDIRSPLISVHNLLELLAMEALDRQKQERLIKDNKARLESTIEMVDNILLWTRQQLSIDFVKIESIEVCDLIQEIIEYYQPKAEELGINLSHFCSRDCIVQTDINITRLVLQNLISNALKFTPRGGQVTIKTKEKDDVIRVSVHDTGTGIDKKVQGKILDENHSYFEDGLHNEKGHGLGLKLCKYFIEQSGGKLWFESEKGKGTVFYFILPQHVD
ncbi:MAG: tetratricopeptide repeat protein [Bacteroidales bacterium]|nr:tetratricopeptide repeat protein [Bacteroidales bacterium]MCF8344760.1 tetratricopeptide repeat protein [Bacteroidales bacterium]MCF8352215.1 tetratricopeptide repeat protein [Bacteroidales bacterium]MCF8375688.1 tetratricopeptide repeat protein [Bacteroidales bacterium]MCF8400288.1 tetratricopeptide repeat protein [Bacteroidales bacterium]